MSKPKSKRRRTKTYKPESKSKPVRVVKEKAPKGPSPERIARMSRFQKEALGIK